MNGEFICPEVAGVFAVTPVAGEPKNKRVHAGKVRLAHPSPSQRIGFWLCVLKAGQHVEFSLSELGTTLKKARHLIYNINQVEKSLTRYEIYHHGDVFAVRRLR